jgi:hypothetical protein
MGNHTLKLAMKYSNRFYPGKLVTLFALLISGCMSVPGYTPLGSLPQNSSPIGTGLVYNSTVAMNGMPGNYVAGNYVPGNMSIANTPLASPIVSNSNPTTPSDIRMPVDATQQLSSGPTEVAMTKGNTTSRDQMQYVNSIRSAP